jgi:hypothetical protein
VQPVFKPLSRSIVFREGEFALASEGPRPIRLMQAGRKLAGPRVQLYFWSMPGLAPRGLTP